MPGLRYPIEMVMGTPVMTAPEELDAGNADWLRAVLLVAASRRYATFVVDMTGTRFCGSAGINVLVAAHNSARGRGGELRLVIPATAASVRRVFAITGLGSLIPIFTDLDQALAPAPAAAPPPPATATAMAPQAGNAHPRGAVAADPGAAPSPA